MYKKIISWKDRCFIFLSEASRGTRAIVTVNTTGCGVPFPLEKIKY